MNATSHPLGVPAYRQVRVNLLGALWIALCVAFFSLGALGGVMIGSMLADTSLHDTYYVVAHSRWMLSIGALLVLYTAFHLVAPRLLAGRYRRHLAWWHLALTSLGMGLLSAPQIGLGLAPPQRYVDYESEFAIWQVVSTAGYAMLAVSGLLFVVLCVALFLPRRGADT